MITKNLISYILIASFLVSQINIQIKAKTDFEALNPFLINKIFAKTKEDLKYNQINKTLNYPPNSFRSSLIQNDSFLALNPPINPKTYKLRKSYFVIITGYSSTPSQTDDTPFITAFGTHVREGIAAANFLPFGTAIKIPEIFGDKIFIIEDRMNERFLYNIDIWFPQENMAKEFGVKFAEIEIVS